MPADPSSSSAPVAADQSASGEEEVTFSPSELRAGIQLEAGTPVMINVLGVEGKPLPSRASRSGNNGS